MRNRCFHGGGIGDFAITPFPGIDDPGQDLVVRKSNRIVIAAFQGIVGRDIQSDSRINRDLPHEPVGTSL